MRVRFEFVMTRGDGSTVEVEQADGQYYVTEYTSSGSFQSTCGAWNELGRAIEVAEEMGEADDC